MAATAPGLIVAAPASGSGKTLVTLGLLRHFRRHGVAVAPFKTGPDYIDAAFLAAAANRGCVNLDCWAMRRETLASLAAGLGNGAELIIGEGVMGLFDGATGAAGDTTDKGRSGSTADLAALAGWPVVLVVDVSGQGASAAAVVRGFAGHRRDVDVAGVVFNRTGGATHAAMLRAAMAGTGDVAVLGCMPRDRAMATPERHLGLVQAVEHHDLERLVEAAADAVGEHIDTAALRALARPARITADGPAGATVPPLGQRIAVARDAAFSFAYSWLLDGWRRAGAEVGFFSPLADESPDERADAVYLPGGYPELHAGRLAANGGFMAGLWAAAGRGAAIYGECGGYMVLGFGLTDADGDNHPMAGLLPLATSFAEPRLHLGYRRLTLQADGPLGKAGAAFRGHEFHYASVVEDGDAAPLFAAADAAGGALPHMGAAAGSVAGSFAHLIDRAP